MLQHFPGVFRTYRYIVDIFTIIIGDEVIEVDPMYVNYLALEKDFDNDVFPIFQVEFSLNDDTYYKLLNNKENSQFKIRIMKYLYDDNNKIRAKRQLINDIFIAFIEEEAPQVDSKMKKTANTEALLIANKTLRVFLFKKQDLVDTKNYINGIYQQVTMIDMITYMLATSGIKKVLVAPFHNIKRYDEIRIPPLTLIDALDYLENVYDGYFNKGSIKFFDYDCMYFVDKGSKNNVYRNSEHTQNVISILDPTTTQSKISGCYIDDSTKKTYINVPPESLSKSCVSILNEHVNANNAIIISPTSGKVTRVEPPVREMTGKVYKLLIDRYSNKRAISNYTNMISENDSIINIGIQGVDVSSFTPNKQFNVIFEDNTLNKQLGGDYRLSKVQFIFKKEGNEFSLTGESELKKLR